MIIRDKNNKDFNTENKWALYLSVLGSEFFKWKFYKTEQSAKDAYRDLYNDWYVRNQGWRYEIRKIHLEDWINK